MAARHQRIGYLSGAPSVSTRPDAASGGARAHILGLTAGLRALGRDVRPFIVGDRHSPKVSDGRLQGVLERSRLLRPAGDVARLALATVNAGSAYRTLNGHVDLVYERFATFGAMGRRFQKAGVPWVLETQGLFFYEVAQERPNVALLRLAERHERWVYRKCDLLVCVSEPLRDLLIERCNVPASRILVLPNAVEIERFAPRAAKQMRQFPFLTIGFVGALIAWQALEELIGAIARLDADGVRIGLIVVGDGPMRAAWTDLARQLGIADRVLFRGRIPFDEVPAQIADFDLGYCGPKAMAIGAMYHSPLKLYEYMAMARPVVAASFADARQLIEHGHNGLLFAPGDPVRLTEALREAAIARDRLPAMGRQARAAIEAKHTWRNRAETLVGEVERRFGAPNGVAAA